MATVKLNRTIDQFWKMTPRHLHKLIDQWRKMESEKMKQIAELTGLSVAHFQTTGKSPFASDRKKTVIVDNDKAFAGL